MPKKQYSIQWREQDLAEVERVVKNFNAKINRVKRNNPKAETYLPNTVTKKDIINSIGTRADFNRTLNAMKRFSKRGAEAPVKSKRGALSTKWGVEEFNRDQGRLNAQRTRERKKIEEKEVLTRGRGTGVTRAQMGSIKENSLKPSKKNFENMSNKEWDKAKKAIDRQLNEVHKAFSKSNMRMNYIKGLQEAGFSDDIVAMVRDVDIDKFIEIVETDAEASFDFIYDPLEFRVKDEALREVWSAASEL